MLAIDPPSSPVARKIPVDTRAERRISTAPGLGSDFSIHQPIRGMPNQFIEPVTDRFTTFAKPRVPQEDAINFLSIEFCPSCSSTSSQVLITGSMKTRSLVNPLPDSTHE